MSRLGILALSLMVLGCGGKEEEEGETNSCGDSLECGAGEFCLVYLAAGASTGEEEYSCEPLPSGCDSFDHMCFDDPDVCIEDWVTEVCGDNILGSGCIVFGGLQQASCQEASSSR